MRKIKLFCAVLVIVSVLLVTFASCGGNKDAEETTTTPVISDVDYDSVFTAELFADNAVISKDGKEFQTVKYPIASSNVIDITYAKEHYGFIDMNFDGIPDFYIGTNEKDGLVNFYCWIYNESAGKFEYHIFLSSLKSISVDSNEQVIYSKVFFEGTEKVVCYRWVNGELKLDTLYDTSKDTVPESITQAMKDNNLADKKPETTPQKPQTKPDKNEATDKNDKPSSNGGETNKPAKPTITSPSNGEGVSLGTGNIDEGWF